MTRQEIVEDIAKVVGVHLGAVAVSFTNVERSLKLLSLLVAIGYGLWKWRVDYLKNKKES